MEKGKYCVVATHELTEEEIQFKIEELDERLAEVKLDQADAFRSLASSTRNANETLNIVKNKKKEFNKEMKANALVSFYSTLCGTIVNPLTGLLVGGSMFVGTATLSILDKNGYIRRRKELEELYMFHHDNSFSYKEDMDLCDEEITRLSDERINYELSLKK